MPPVGEVVDEVQQPVVGPVEVLEREHERVARRPSARGTAATRRTAPRGEPLLERAADECSDVRRDLEVAEQLVDGAVHLLRDDLGRVVLEDLALRLHRLRECGVRHVPVREATGPASSRGSAAGPRRTWRTPTRCRDFPTPAFPSTVTSAGRPSDSTRCNVCFRTASSSSRPTRRDSRPSGGRSPRRRALTRSACHAGTGPALPFSSSGSRSA